MPDATMSLLAMYQQILGAPVPREQAALEGACAQRVLLSGLTISPTGTFAFPGNLTVGGALTVGSLNLTGNLAVSGTLNVTGQTTLGAGLGVTGTFTVNGIGAVQTAGSCSFTVRHTLAGTTSRTDLRVGNDIDSSLLDLVSLSSTYAPTLGFDVANSSLIWQNNAGLTVACVGGPILFATGSPPTEKFRVDFSGRVLVNTAPLICQLAIAFGDGNATGIGMINRNGGNSGYFLNMLNSASALCGSISQTGATTVAFNTSSDARLKTDRGLVSDLTALKAVKVHDFTWNSDGATDRGVFAQEVIDPFPRAVTPGVGAPDAPLTEPQQTWQVDYSKFVADLIAGWQDHEARLAQLEQTP